MVQGRVQHSVILHAYPTEESSPHAGTLLAIGRHMDAEKVKQEEIDVFGATQKVQAPGQWKGGPVVDDVSDLGADFVAGRILRVSQEPLPLPPRTCLH